MLSWADRAKGMGKATSATTTPATSAKKPITDSQSELATVKTQSTGSNTVVNNIVASHTHAAPFTSPSVSASDVSDNTAFTEGVDSSRTNTALATPSPDQKKLEEPVKLTVPSQDPPTELPVPVNQWKLRAAAQGKTADDAVKPVFALSALHNQEAWPEAMVSTQKQSPVKEDVSAVEKQEQKVNGRQSALETLGSLGEFLPAKKGKQTLEVSFPTMDPGKKAKGRKDDRARRFDRPDTPPGARAQRASAHRLAKQAKKSGEGDMERRTVSHPGTSRENGGQPRPMDSQAGVYAQPLMHGQMMPAHAQMQAQFRRPPVNQRYRPRYPPHSMPAFFPAPGPMPMFQPNGHVPFMPAPMMMPMMPPIEVQNMQVLTQLDFYFSTQNLSKDLFLREKMDAEGWVPLRLLASFKRLQILTTNLNQIYDCALRSTLLETSRQGGEIFIRRRDEWQKFVLPGARPTHDLPPTSPSQEAPKVANGNDKPQDQSGSTAVVDVPQSSTEHGPI